MAAICYDTETFYDVILIDGQDCMSYIGYAIKRISEGGMIIFDNSDYSGIGKSCFLLRESYQPNSSD